MLTKHLLCTGHRVLTLPTLSLSAEPQARILIQVFSGGVGVVRRRRECGSRMGQEKNAKWGCGPSRGQTGLMGAPEHGSHQVSSPGGREVGLLSSLPSAAGSGGQVMQSGGWGVRQHLSTAFSILTTLWGRYNDCPYYTDEENEAWRGKVPWPGSPASKRKSQDSNSYIVSYG